MTLHSSVSMKRNASISLHSAVVTISKISKIFHPSTLARCDTLVILHSPILSKLNTAARSHQKNAHRRGHFTYLAVGHHFAARSSNNMHSLMHTKHSVKEALRSPIPIERDSFMILHSDISVKCDTSAILHRRIVEKTRILEISNLLMVAKCDSLVTCICQSL